MSEPKGKMTHPDPEVLAEFRAGLITGRHGARISAHLASCDRCTGRCGELTEVSALLAAVPVPAMPDALARRLDGVLAAEVAGQKDYSERAVDPRPRDRASSPRPRRHWDFRLVALRVLAPAAAVVVLAAGGYGLSRIGSGGPSSHTASSGSTASSPPAAAAGSAAFPSSRHEADQGIGTPATFAVVASTTYYQRSTLRQQLARELQRHARGLAGPQELASASVKGCVALVTRDIRPGTLVLVEKAHYQGQPANVIVAASGPRDAGWVTTPACSGSRGYVLDTTTLPGTSAS